MEREMLNDAVKEVAATLAADTNALSFEDFVMRTKLSPRVVGEALDLLVLLRLFKGDPFGYEAFDPIMYSFPENANAQEFYNNLVGE
jgi:hypothetical protein